MWRERLLQARHGRPAPARAPAPAPVVLAAHRLSPLHARLKPSLECQGNQAEWADVLAAYGPKGYTSKDTMALLRALGLNRGEGLVRAAEAKGGSAGALLSGCSAALA